MQFHCKPGWKTGAMEASRNESPGVQRLASLPELTLTT
jgi:hypothetical protein